MGSFDEYLSKVGEYGVVERIRHPIVMISGLPGVRVGEIVVFEDESFGQVTILDQAHVTVLLFGRQSVRLGTRAARTDEILTIPVGAGLTGYVLDPFGGVIKAPANAQKISTRKGVFSQIRPIFERARITQPLVSGVTLLDFLIPLGKGQKELIIGDRKTGKTSMFLPMIKKQKNSGTVFVYALIGKNKAEAKRTIEIMETAGVADTMVFVVSYANDSPGLINLTPHTAMTIAEEYKDQGIDSVVILDDLSTHARFYRELSLISGVFPGRESYPGDIFYVHARLLERAGNFKIQGDKTASITCFPIVETIDGDLTAHIATNIMGMTDGHIFFDSDAYYNGRRPAINFGLSVTRVGRNVQPKIIKELYGEIAMFLTQYEKLQNFSHFGAELSKHVQDQLKKGDGLYEHFNQQVDEVRNQEVDLLIFGLIWSGILFKDQTVDLAKLKLHIYDLYTTNEQVRAFIGTLVKVEKLYQLLINVVKQEFELRKLWQTSSK